MLGQRRFGSLDVMVALAIGGLGLTSFYSYAFFHSLAEILRISVAVAIFMLVWNVRKSLDNSYLKFLSVAYVFICGLDILHLFSYKEVGVFFAAETNVTIQLWTGTRYLEAASLVAASFILGQKLRLGFVVAGFSAASGLLLGAVLYWRVFPVCFIEGAGPTPFKTVSNYLVGFLFLASIGRLIRKRDRFDPAVLRLLVTAIAFTFLSELCLSFYIRDYGIPFLLGHLFKIVSFYFLYKTIIEMGLAKPMDVLFRNLKLSEEALSKAHNELEIRVEQRTKELAEANEWLRKEISERKQAEESLRESEHQLRSLSSQILTAQETERRRIAREIHDEMGGALAVLKLRTSQVERNLPDNRTDLKEELRRNLTHIDEIIENARRLSRDLSPSILEDIGLTPALRWLVDNFVKDYQIQMAFDIVSIDHLFPKDSQIMIYRVFQEALTNIGKHAQAANVSAQVQLAADSVSFIIEDDGRGFDLRSARAKEDPEKGLGLATMDERARMLGGTLEIKSAAGKGTRITLFIPLGMGDKE